MRQIFALAPAQTSAVWILYVLVFVFALLLAIHLYFSRQAGRIQVAVTDTELAITGGWYGRSVPRSSLRIADARAVRLGASEYRLKWRTNGIGLPGYQAGWFRTAGAGKALVFLTTPERVLAIPTDQGFTLLLGVSDPDALLTALKR